MLSVWHMQILIEKFQNYVRYEAHDVKFNATGDNDSLNMKFTVLNIKSGK